MTNEHIDELLILDDILKELSETETFYCSSNDYDNGIVAGVRYAINVIKKHLRSDK